MDGLDFTSIDQIDQDVFNKFQSDSDDSSGPLPIPDCIGIDSAIQDDEDSRLKQKEAELCSRFESRSKKERDLELSVLKSNSIRRQILERSLNNGRNQDDSLPCGTTIKDNSTAHVMNITEKAGMNGVDKDRINQIIHEASKGSLFYKKQAQRQAEIHKSIEKMLYKVKSATPAQIEDARVTCDRLVQELEQRRIFNRIVVHFDLDMFFAAVEIRDNPELKDKPVAVGGDSMVSTSNYIARKYGVRAAMPGFIAKKLCPDLILIKPNGSKYRDASSKVFSILEMYDPDLTSMSLDEAYLDLTEYIKNTLERDNIEHEEYYDGQLPKIWWNRASEIVDEIRQAIFKATQLTCSAGISCNTLLAKISTDINKPNGQYMVEGYPADVINFIRKTPVEKVSGIGKVSSQFLAALDIKTCGDLYKKRHFLPLVFYEINVRFYLRVALGFGSNSIKTNEQRKSKSVERTFSAVKDPLVLLDKLEGICEQLCSKYLKPYRIKGRTITVKLKRNTFMTTTKSYSMLVATNDKQVIFSAAKNLMLTEMANEPPEISYRLLGVKLSNLADDGIATNQLTIEAMLKNQELVKPTSESQIEDPILSDWSKEQNNLASLLVTQEPTSPDDSILRHCLDSQKLGGADLPSISEAPKKRLPPPTKIESFFAKRSRSQKVEKDTCLPGNNTTNLDSFFSQEEDEEFFDASSHCNLDSMPNRMSQEERRKNLPTDEDFQCPYCFKTFSDFNILECHVESCYHKTPIDVNKSFFSQRSQLSAQPNKIAKSSHSKPKSSSTAKPKTRRQVKPSAGITTLFSQMTPTRSQSFISKEGGTQKPSFYQKFIESNSQSLSQSVKLEPFQCPYCHHGFLNFSTLETHVIMCTKQK